MERRNFLKNTCSFCLLGFTGASIVELASCTAPSNIYSTSVQNNLIHVPVKIFKINTLQIVRPKELLYDIAVSKNTDNSFSALLLQCTHQDNQLTVYPNGYQCSLHGSQFDINGKVVKGPASKPLKNLSITQEGTNLIIHI